jgi:hypothetical protein
MRSSIGPSSNETVLGDGEGGALGPSFALPHRKKPPLGVVAPLALRFDEELFVASMAGARKLAVEGFLEGAREATPGPALGSSRPLGNTVLNNL